MSVDRSRISSVNCEHCSRGPGSGHHDDCPRHPLALAKFVEAERVNAAAEYATTAIDVELLALDDPQAAMRAAFAAGAQWAAAKASAAT